MTSGVYKRTEETRRKMSLAQKGKNHPFYGKHHSEESKRKISLALIGRVVSEETRRKLSLANKGKNHPFYGKHHSEEHKQKIRDAAKRNPNYGMRGKHQSEEAKRKLSLAHTGKILSGEHRKNISLAQKGIPRSEETKRKISLAHKGKIKSKEHIEKIHLTKKRLFKEGKLKVWNKGMPMLEESKKKMSAVKQGIDIKNWKKFTGREPYSQEWDNKFRRLIRKRDNQVCMLCGIHREKLSRVLHVHHINYDKKLTIPQNCICLCNSCHGKTNAKRKYWVDFFQSLLTKNYDYVYEDGIIVVEI